MARLLGPFLILVCTVIWGAAFLAQKTGADHYGPFAINCGRNILGGAFLWICIVIRDRRRKVLLEGILPADAGLRVSCGVRRLFLGGSLSGICLFAAMMAQQLGIESTSPGISAFLTANYVLIVPILAWISGKGAPAPGVWIGVALALLGTSFICFSDFSSMIAGVRLGAGEAWTLLCAVLFAVQIMVVDRFARNVDVLKFSMTQLLVAAACAFPFLFLPSELARNSWSHFVAGLPALFFVGVMSSGIAYTLQNFGQAKTPPALAAIIMSMESVFGALFGWLFLHDVLTLRQLTGCILVLSAVILSQLMPFVWRRRD